VPTVNGQAGLPDDHPDRVPDRTPVTQQVGRVVLVLVAVVFTVFALDNAQHVDFSWVVGGTEVVQQAGDRVSGGVRLIVLLVLAFLAGGTVGALAMVTRARRRAAVERDDP
jgi:uncharacterized integral membrane protein